MKFCKLVLVSLALVLIALPASASTKKSNSSRRSVQSSRGGKSNPFAALFSRNSTQGRRSKTITTKGSTSGTLKRAKH